MTGNVEYLDYTPEKMVEMLESVKASGNAVCIHSQTGETFDMDEGIKFYRSLCSGLQAIGT